MSWVVASGLNAASVDSEVSQVTTMVKFSPQAGAPTGQEPARPGFVREGLAGDDAAGVPRRRSARAGSSRAPSSSTMLAERAWICWWALAAYGSVSVARRARRAREPVGRSGARGTPAQHVGRPQGAARPLRAVSRSTETATFPTRSCQRFSRWFHVRSGRRPPRSGRRLADLRRALDRSPRGRRHGRRARTAAQSSGERRSFHGSLRIDGGPSSLDRRSAPWGSGAQSGIASTTSAARS